MWKYVLGATLSSLLYAYLGLFASPKEGGEHYHVNEDNPQIIPENISSYLTDSLFKSRNKKNDFPQREEGDTILRYPIPQAEYGSVTPPQNKSLYSLARVTEEVSFLPATQQYVITQKMGDLVVSTQTLSFDEYLKYDLDKSITQYWKNKNSSYTPTTSFLLKNYVPELDVNLDFLNDAALKDLIDIKMQGSAQLIFGFMANRRDDPAMDINQRKTFNFIFDQKLEINLNAKIANRFDFSINHNTEAFFQFDNKLKLKYEGKEDEIIKSLEAGDVSFPLNTSLIQGVQNLFGVKTKLQFGKTYVSAVFSEQRSESKSVTVEGGAQNVKIDFKADDYEENRHYFIAQYFEQNYHKALANLPVVNSNISITKIEVWITNIGAPVENNRNIVAFTDLGEKNPMASNVTGDPFSRYPSNNSNNLLQQVNPSSLRDISSVTQYLNTIGYSGGTQFEKVESARRLNDNEYTYNPVLGFVSLNSPLNSDQVLAVSYQYQIIGDSTIYQVGELSDQGILDPQTLIVKLLKPTSLNTKSPLWKLMMKNVYSLRSYQVSNEDFRLNILYSGGPEGVPTGYFQDGPKSGIPLIRVFGMDNLDFQGNRSPDGVFDFLDRAATTAGYIESSKGLIYMPYTEPFGRDLGLIFGDSVAAIPYAYPELYELTKVEAQQYPDKNKFYFNGQFKSAQGSEISLGAYNIPRGSVKVLAGGSPLIEDVDYTVDYPMGIVRITNQGVLNSGIPIKISTESNSMSMMTKRMMGLRVEHIFSKNLYVGATVLNLHQSPLTMKVNYGEEPISNTLYGFDASYENESRFLTKAVDAILPFSASKTPARISVYGEFAHFLPGHSKAIGSSGTTYIDDFEGSKTTFNLKDPYAWSIASTPQYQLDLFLESDPSFAHTSVTGMNRAKLAWYTIDQLFYKDNRPKNISKEDLSEPYSREVFVTEVFPNKQLASGEPLSLSILNLAFYPTEKGPYNFDAKGVPNVTAGINLDATLKEPGSRWGGIMRKIENTDFESSNVEYIEFWVMDPFIGRDGKDGNPKHSGGKLYFNLGDVSEDVLRDGKKAFENGMPISPEVVDVEETQWGRVPKNQSIVRTFDNDPNTRQYQDIGLDGLNDADERVFFVSYLDEIEDLYGRNSVAWTKMYDDPSSDNFHYFRGSDYDQLAGTNKIENRYKKFNNPQGNSPSSTQNTESYPTQQSNYPNSEDISGDNTLSEAENYYQYVVNFDPDQMQVGKGYLTDIQESRNIKLPNGKTTSVKWYQYKIPIRTPDKVVGQIQNFQSIRFIRMFLKDFEEDVIFRFASLDLVKGDWRKYQYSLIEDGMHVPNSSSDKTAFNISVVNIEENGHRQPIPYVMPPDIERMIDPATQNLRQLNEQSLSLQVKNLQDGDARGIYKTARFDFRQFKKIKMYVHLEKINEYDMQVNGDVTLFIRFGADFQDNYYEYEIPLHYTNWGESAPSAVWNPNNRVQLDLGDLVSVKEERNALVRSENSAIKYSDAYTKYIGNAKYVVKGTPNISDVQTILIGIRNPQKNRSTPLDDGMPKSVEVWINELSLNDFNKKGGVAGTIRAQALLGDLGNINMSGTFTQANFGSIEQKIMELPKDNVTSFDISTNLELGKFLPPKVGLRLPVHYDVSGAYSVPEYSPIDPDVKTSTDLDSYKPEDRANLKKEIVDYTTRQNVNFINVRKERTNSEATPRFYDIENFNVTYAYSRISKRNIDIEYDNKVAHRGGFGYDYSFSPNPVLPFAKTSLAKNKNFAILTDFNFNYVPSQFSFNTEVLREYNENKLRNKSWADIIIEPTYFKRFDWVRNYSLRYDLTKSIVLVYSASSNSYIEEPPGKINTKEKKDSIWNSVFDFGKTRNFTQDFSATWKLPINKIPLLSWVNADLSYNSLYKWEAGSLALQERMGNTISNNQGLGGKANLDLVQLYNKVPFLKKINTPPARRRTQPASNRILAKGGSGQDDGDVFKKIYSAFFRLLMGFRTAEFSYTANRGMVLPGFMPEPFILGNNFDVNAPGLGFAFGSQKDITVPAIANSWLSKDSLMNTPNISQFTETFAARTLFEPFRDFRIDINMGYSRAENAGSYIKYDYFSNQYVHMNKVGGGNYTVSNLMISTSFLATSKDFSNDAYSNFLEYRYIVAERLCGQNPNSADKPYVYDTAAGRYFPYGYTSTSQEVMIPALIAAYSGADPNKVNLSALSKFPLPNWKVSYSGLSKLKAVKKYFKSVVLEHAYTSSYNVGSYTKNILFRTDEQGNPIAVDNNFNYLSGYFIDGVNMTEQFSPLVKFALTMNNDLSLSFEVRKGRQILLSFVNNQLTEVKSDEYIVGSGYRIKDVGFKIGMGGASKKEVKSDIVIKLDFSLKDNKTILRKIDQSVFIASAGAKITSLNVYAEYDLSKALTARVFYEIMMSSPHIANMFYNRTAKGGLSFTYRFNM